MFWLSIVSDISEFDVAVMLTGLSHDSAVSLMIRNSSNFSELATFAKMLQDENQWPMGDV